MSKGPSAWRLNKQEQNQVNKDLDAWAEANSTILENSEEEFNRLKEDEKRRLTRVIQEQKHQRSLAKQSAKAKATPGAAAPVAPSPSSSTVNQPYFQKLSDDLLVIATELGDLKSEKPIPIQTRDVTKGGVQDN